MSAELIKKTRKVIAGKGGRIEDQELEEMAKSIANLGFKIGFARAYANGPTLMAELCDRLEEAEQQLNDIIRTVINRK